MHGVMDNSFANLVDAVQRTRAGVLVLSQL